MWLRRRLDAAMLRICHDQPPSCLSIDGCTGGVLERGRHVSLSQDDARALRLGTIGVADALPLAAFARRGAALLPPAAFLATARARGVSVPCRSVVVSALLLEGCSCCDHVRWQRRWLHRRRWRLLIVPVGCRCAAAFLLKVQGYHANELVLCP